jgi:hypothetical protein
MDQYNGAAVLFAPIDHGSAKAGLPSSEVQFKNHFEQSKGDGCVHAIDPFLGWKSGRILGHCTKVDEQVSIIAV